MEGLQAQVKAPDSEVNRNYLKMRIELRLQLMLQPPREVKPRIMSTQRPRAEGFTTSIVETSATPGG